MLATGNPPPPPRLLFVTFLVLVQSAAGTEALLGLAWDWLGLGLPGTGAGAGAGAGAAGGWWVPCCQVQVPGALRWRGLRISNVPRTNNIPADAVLSFPKLKF
jgi:hypothetical protein